MTGRWSYEITALTNLVRIVDHAPFTGVKIADALDGGGSVTGRLPISFPGWQPLVTGGLMRRVIWPARAGQPVGGFLVTGMSWSAGDSTVSIKATRLDAILQRRRIAADLNFEQVDQFDIWRDLLRYGLGRTTMRSSPRVPGDGGVYGSRLVPWIRLGDELSGTKRDRPATSDDGYPASARKIVATAMKQLAEVQGGFEVRWDCARDTETGYPFMRPVLGSPTVGRPEGAPGNLVFEWPGGNISAAPFAADGWDMISRADVLGQESQGDRPIGSAFAPTLLDEDYPLLEGVWSESSTTGQAALDESAAHRLHGLTDSWSLTLAGQRRPYFGTYRLGDVVVLRMRPEGVRFPDRSLRITGWSVAPDDSGVGETVSPTVVPLAGV